MSEIQRYSLEIASVYDTHVDMIKDDFGAYVEYRDHASRIKQLEQELESAKKDQARYQYVRNMPPEDFSGIKGDCAAFDKAIDAAIKEISK